MLDAGEAILVDVREPDEQRRSRIAGSLSAPSSIFEPEEVHEFAGDRCILVICRSGQRSSQAAARLAHIAPGRVAGIRGGIESWQAVGLPSIEDRSAPLPIMQQVHIVIGALVAGFTALGLLVSQWFLLVPCFLGCGLVFAGLTGVCGLARLLEVLPWNRPPAAVSEPVIGARKTAAK